MLTDRLERNARKQFTTIARGSSYNSEVRHTKIGHGCWGSWAYANCSWEILDNPRREPRDSGVEGASTDKRVHSADRAGKVSNRKRKAKKSRAAGEQRRSHTDGAARARDKGEGRCWEPRRVGILLTLMIGCRGQPLGWRGVRVGEAANPGPYTEGGATGSGLGIRVGT